MVVCVSYGLCLWARGSSLYRFGVPASVVCGLYASLLLGLFVPSRFIDSAAVVSFGYLGFFLWSLLDLCVELSPMH